MKTSNGRHIYLKAVAPVTGNRSDYDATKLPSVVDAGKLSNQRLLQHLCTAGPRQCGECRLCSYGREWLRREGERRMNTSEGTQGALWEVSIRLRTGRYYTLVGTFDECMEKLREMKKSVKRATFVVQG